MLHSIRAALSAVVFVFGLCGLPSGVRGADSPRLVVLRAPSGITIGGDSNNPAVWVGDRIQVFASPFAQDDKLAGVSFSLSGPSIEHLDAQEYVDADRSLISTAPLPSFGPWF